MNFELIRLLPASVEDYNTIQNMARFYVYDLSEYLGHQDGWETPLDGLYECIDFKMYWDHSDTQFPFLIYYKDEIAGFVIVDKVGIDKSVDFNIAQFFIIRKFKRLGIGRYVAHLCFDKFVGKWNVMCLVGNMGAYMFWHSVVATYTTNVFDEFKSLTLPHLQDTYNVFSFYSKDYKKDKKQC